MLENVLLIEQIKAGPNVHFSMLNCKTFFFSWFPSHSLFHFLSSLTFCRGYVVTEPGRQQGSEREGGRGGEKRREELEKWRRNKGVERSGARYWGRADSGIARDEAEGEEGRTAGPPERAVN